MHKCKSSNLTYSASVRCIQYSFKVKISTKNIKQFGKVKNNLTSEWNTRQITNHNNPKLKEKECVILTNVISQGAFGISTKHHKEIKGLKRGDLKDSMQEIELIFKQTWGVYKAYKHKERKCTRLE